MEGVEGEPHCTVVVAVGGKHGMEPPLIWQGAAPGHEVGSPVLRTRDVGSPQIKTRAPRPTGQPQVLRQLQQGGGADSAPVDPAEWAAASSLSVKHPRFRMCGLFATASIFEAF